MGELRSFTFASIEIAASGVEKVRIDLSTGIQVWHLDQSNHTLTLR